MLSKGYLGIRDKEDILNNLLTSPLAFLVKEVLIPDLDMEVLVLKILSNNLDLFLASEFPPCFCLPTEIIIIFSSKC